MSIAALTLVPHPNAKNPSRGFIINVYSPPKVADPAPVFIAVTHEVGYYVDHRTDNVTLTYINRETGALQKLVSLPNPFYRLFPQLDRRSFGGCLEMSSDELIALGFMMPGYARPMITV